MDNVFQYNAELVIRRIQESLRIALSYDEESVGWLDGYISRLRKELTPESRDKLVDVFGSFFGESIGHTYGGDWREIDGQWAIAFDGQNAIFPFNKIRKHFENEEGSDSILSLYTLIPRVFDKSIQPEEIIIRQTEDTENDSET